MPVQQRRGEGCLELLGDPSVQLFSLPRPCPQMAWLIQSGASSFSLLLSSLQCSHMSEIRPLLSAQQPHATPADTPEHFTLNEGIELVMEMVQPGPENWLEILLMCWCLTHKVNEELRMITIKQLENTSNASGYENQLYSTTSQQHLLIFQWLSS
ncbi:hypothetical protein P7K49_021137 [Saguinus oedipus]|uniref:Uncharacterized protein n=1 Tax=Saguinus oedipus TaxID=9490 RepID=A0ABQ9USI0_SAGOE|nr:hypothetical protein P7K49_021137 [Saguinus oedipus]